VKSSDTLEKSAAQSLLTACMSERLSTAAVNERLQESDARLVVAVAVAVAVAVVQSVASDYCSVIADRQVQDTPLRHTDKDSQAVRLSGEQPEQARGGFCVRCQSYR
jgi:hypothetical protein